jgi:hypothetical protein
VKRVLVALLLICGVWKGWADDKYYVQLIKATNEPKPPAKGAKQIGNNLGERLSPLRWKYYWEVQRRETSLAPTGAKKVQLNGDRAVEIAPLENGRVEVRLYRGKDLARKSCHRVHDRMMAIFGGDEGEVAWFVVVRREEPQYEVARD